MSELITVDAMVLIAMCDWNVFRPMCCLNKKLHKILDYNKNKKRWVRHVGLWGLNIADVLSSNYMVTFTNKNRIYIYKYGVLVKKIWGRINENNIYFIYGLWRYKYKDDILYEEYASFVHANIEYRRIKSRSINGVITDVVLYYGNGFIDRARLDYEDGFFIY
jgi:hypothetical protein